MQHAHAAALLIQPINVSLCLPLIWPHFGLKEMSCLSCLMWHCVPQDEADYFFYLLKL